MNETYHAFWYRPFWQQILPIVTFIGVFFIAGYFTYWKQSSSQLNELEIENTNLLNRIQQEELRILQSPSINLLTQQIQSIELPSIHKAPPIALFSHFHSLVSQSGVTLNQLQPVNNNEGYLMEVQGNFANISLFIQKLISSSTSAAWYYPEITLSLRKNTLIASVTLSSIFHLTTIKDENSYE